MAFSCLDPQAYQGTVRRLREEETKRTSWAKRMADRIQHELAASHIIAAVNWRVKHAYRAWLESRESGIDIGQLHDVIAFRVLVNTQEECYQSLGVIHRLWHPTASVSATTSPVPRSTATNRSTPPSSPSTVAWPRCTSARTPCIAPHSTASRHNGWS